MTLLVTVDQAKAHLEMDHDLSDELIEMQIHIASEAVLGYLKDAALTFTDTSGELILDSSGNPDIPWRVKGATLMLLGALFGNRGEDGGLAAGFTMGFLPPAVTSLLYPLRIPTVG